MAGVPLAVAGRIRVGPVRTPPEPRGRGSAGAVTTEAGRAAPAAGAAEVLFFADLANPTGNALHPRVGYRKAAGHGHSSCFRQPPSPSAT